MRDFTAASSQADTSVLHPYRKRKFFFELAELLDEPPFALPLVPPPQVASVAISTADSSQDALSASFSVSTNDNDSCAFVHFDVLQDTDARALVSQGSGFESTQDSAGFMPATATPTTDRTWVTTNTSSNDRGCDQEETEVVSSVCGGSQPAPPPELVDYWDSDRMCEGTPCWLYDEQT